MKITKIDVRNLLIPLKIPYALQKSYGTKSHTCCVIVKIYTDEGIWGVGECNPQPGFTDESAESVKAMIAKVLGPAIIGMDPTDMSAIDKKMDIVCKNNNLPKAAINTACYDIAGKAVKVMVSAFGCAPVNIRAAIGPNIGFCCFETDAEVPEAMVSAFGDGIRDCIRPTNNKYYVNLKEINRYALLRAGVGHVEVSTHCTACAPQRFWSHRVTRGNRGSQGAVIVCKEREK